jgi:diadenosine tetraphosphate (Ap4A) HIT family hydrolase
VSAPAPGDACPFCALAACRAEAPGAERVHVAVFAEAVPHLHVHLVPRGPEVPPEDRGPGFLFDRAPRVSPERADALARAIVARLRTGS